MFCRLIGLLVLFVLIAIGLVAIRRCPDVVVASIPVKKFTRKEFCEPLDRWEPFELEFTAPTLQLPDLTRELSFYGTSQRPDSDDLSWFLGVDEVMRVRDRAYLSFNQKTCTYHLQESATNLWVEAVVVEKDRVVLKPTMQMADGTIEGEPFTLKRVELPRVSWEIDGMRVDSSLLARIRTKWYGQDLFLSEHGGDEYAHANNRQRFDFGEGEGRYHCFLAQGEGLIWKDGRFQEAASTEGYPLLYLKRVDHQLLALELWDPKGRVKTPLSLMRSKGVSLPSQMRLQFVAAKTWTQFVLDSGDQRLEVGPGDWLFLDNGGWERLDSAEAIDDYVAMRKMGALLVVEGLARADGRRVLVGHLFNRTRTSVEPMEIPLSTFDHKQNPIAAVKKVENRATKRRFISPPKALEAS